MGENWFPAMNCRAIFISPCGTKNPFLSPILVDDVMTCRAVPSCPYGIDQILLLYQTAYSGKHQPPSALSFPLDIRSVLIYSLYMIVTVSESLKQIK